jgi:TetR/AcrR family transcriptional regulator, transcriptional repressor for nem operon
VRTRQIFDRLGEEIPVRERILAAAADLMHTRGVAATTLDDVRAGHWGASKAQSITTSSTTGLIDTVIVRQGDELLEAHRRRLLRLDSLRGLKLRRNAIVRSSAVRRGA